MAENKREGKAQTLPCRMKFEKASPASRGDYRLDLFFGATFLPFLRASERPIAIACFRLVTFFPLLPLRRVPRLRLCIARFTSLDALFDVFRAMSVHHTKTNTPSQTPLAGERSFRERSSRPSL